MATCLIGLGANRGDRATSLAAAVDQLATIPHVAVVNRSRVHASKAAVGGAVQAEFLNAAIAIQTSLTPPQVLVALQGIENRLGRRRQERWGAREIDLDLLLYDDLISSDAALVLPHPRMAFRRFVLQPAAEIAPNRVHPTTGFTIKHLLSRLDEAPRRVVVTGASSERNRLLARQVASKTQVSLLDEPDSNKLTDALKRLRAGPSCQAAIELCDQRRDTLRHARQSQLQPRTACLTEVRSSWIGEYHALARLLLPNAERSDFEQRWQRGPELEELDRTTLIAVLPLPGPDVPLDRNMLTAESAEHELLIALDEEVQQLASQPGQSPWLVLDGTDPEWALQEMVAAIEAMH